MCWFPIWGRGDFRVQGSAVEFSVFLGCCSLSFSSPLLYRSSGKPGYCSITIPQNLSSSHVARAQSKHGSLKHIFKPVFQYLEAAQVLPMRWIVDWWSACLLTRVKKLEAT